MTTSLPGELLLETPTLDKPTVVILLGGINRCGDETLLPRISRSRHSLLWEILGSPAGQTQHPQWQLRSCRPPRASINSSRVGTIRLRHNSVPFSVFRSRWLRHSGH